MILYILKGLHMTVGVYVLTLVLSLPLGMFLGVVQASKHKILSKVLNGYTLLFRGTPLLLQLFFVYYGLPIFGISLSPFTAAVVTFVVNYAAYSTEIIRGGIIGIDPGQYEAAKVLGFNKKQTMLKIILPQSLRTSLPALTNEGVALLKDTALISTIGMNEILRSSKELASNKFSIMPYIICGVIYLLMSGVIITVFKKLESRVEI